MKSKAVFNYDQCDETFSKKARLEQHISAIHYGYRYRCPQCSFTFSQKNNLARHCQLKHKELHCLYCGLDFGSQKALLLSIHSDKCLIIRPDEQVDTLDKKQKEEPIIHLIQEDGDTPQNLSDYEEDLQQEVINYWRLIKTKKSTNNLLDHVYNYRWSQINGDFGQMLMDIYLNEKQSFRVDAAIGCILRNRESEEVKYWYACHNNFTLLDNPILVRKVEDVNRISEQMKQLDITEKFTRPNTKWYLAAITNVEFYVIPQVNFVAGCKDFKLPQQTAHQQHNLLGMTQDSNHNKLKDNLCFFRCVAQCISTSFEDEDFVYKSFSAYCDKYNQLPNVEAFAGVTLDEIDMLETLFDVSIQLFYTNEQGIATCWRISTMKQKYHMNLDVSVLENGKVHFAYIVNLDHYAKRYCCLDCGRLFKNATYLKEHSTHYCNNGKTRHKFPGGVFQIKKTVFELLGELDIHVPLNQRYCPFIAVYDFESLLIKKENAATEKLKFTTEHVPASCAISTNVPGFSPTFFTNDDPDQLVQEVLKHFELISLRQREILLCKYKCVIEQLDQKILQCNKCIEEQIANKKDHWRQKGQGNLINNTKQKLIKYCSQLVCLGFNSGKYDINLIKRNLFPSLVQQVRLDEDASCPKAILRNGAYLCLSTDSLKFLDASVYAAPGFSLDTFMRAYKATLTKAHFPYEYLDDYGKLYEKELPPVEGFYSSLRRAGITKEEYKECQDTWRDHHMETMMDYLEFYNLRDVIPFLQACENMSNIYWTNFNIDVFHEAMSLPGVTERYLFKDLPDTNFVLFTEKTKDLHYSLKASMRGGLAMVMNRLAIKNETTIRNNPSEKVRTIIGLDFNALYLWAQAMPTPTGHYDYWEPTGHKTFKKVSTSRKVSTEWLEYEGQKSGQPIQHLGNGPEKKIGPQALPVDGYCQATNTVYEFYGCYWHCHNCPMGRRNNQKDPMKASDWIKEKEDYIKLQGHNLETIWECEWYKSRPKYLAKAKLRKFYNQKFVSQSQMVDAILDGSVFGFATVDISTPEHLKKKYADFPPIIKHAEVCYEDIGEHMQEYAKSTDQMKIPRHSLISSYFGKNILMTTPMIKFLVEHGLILEKIYSVIQYDERRPFEAFRDKVTHHRREGDADPALAMLADTYKLLGNTGYGKTLTNKESHIDVFYCDEEKAIESAYSPYIKRINFIRENCYELHMRKREIRMDLPIVIGLSVYNWAKIKMLEFFYDVLLVYFDETKYQCMETDTDSIYLAIAADELLDIVKPELKEKFIQEVYPNWFVTKIEDKRTPGLLKVEWRGSAMCCLAAKTYIGIGENEKKVSCKGLTKKINDPTFEKYAAVLRTKTPWTGENIGFRMEGGKMWTYIQQKTGLPYLYVKRKVLDDGITTVPLDI